MSTHVQITAMSRDDGDVGRFQRLPKYLPLATAKQMPRCGMARIAVICAYAQGVSLRRLRSAGKALRVHPVLLPVPESV